MSARQIVPAVPLSVWEGLYSAAAKFHQRKPWEAMDNLDLIGMRDPSSNETGYAITMGSGGTLFGLCLYRGTDGFQIYRELITESVDRQPEDFFAMLNCLKLEFGHRGDLQSEDLAVIRQLGLTFRGSHAWPQFRSLIPGYFPWFLTEAEARFFTLALEIVCAHCERVKAGEVNESLRDGECLVYTCPPDSPTRFDARWEPWPIHGAPLVSLPVLNLARINTIMAAKPRRDSPWEGDVFYLPSIVYEGERPCFTRLAVVCQQVSGVAFAFQIIPPEVPAAQALSDMLCDSIEKQGVLPDIVFVKQKEVAAALAPLGKAIGMTVRYDKNLRTIQFIRNELERQLKPRRGIQPHSRVRLKATGERVGADIVYQLKVTLSGSEPRVWRRFLVPAHYTLERLHRVLQVVMGWQNYHLHEFKVGQLSYGEPHPEYGDKMLNHKKVTLAEVAPVGSSFTYIYDFGDGWQHDLKVEKTIDRTEGEHYPRCIEGKRACPPEDCGGIGGFADLLKALQNPLTQEQRELVEWAGDYDPDMFDLATINKRLRKLR